jgi:hypothetical protein
MKMNFKQWVIDLFKDERGSTSVKPVIALLGALFLSVTMTINSFSHSDFAPADNLVDAVLIITAIGMGADTLDKFSSPRKKSESNDSNNEEHA